MGPASRPESIRTGFPMARRLISVDCTGSRTKKKDLPLSHLYQHLPRVSGEFVRENHEARKTYLYIVMYVCRLAGRRVKKLELA
jgi:hypothetical protein